MKSSALLALLGLFGIVRSEIGQRADLYFQCDNIVTRIEYTHYNVPSSPEVWSFESVSWTEEVHVILSNVCRGDQINVYCENEGGPAGFIATMHYGGQTYSTHSGHLSTTQPWFMWRSRVAGGAWEETWNADLQANKGGGVWGGNVGSNIASDAQWIWRNGGYQAIQTQFRFEPGVNNPPPLC
jgi:hypothetical protein